MNPYRILALIVEAIAENGKAEVDYCHISDKAVHNCGEGKVGVVKFIGMHLIKYGVMVV